MFYLHIIFSIVMFVIMIGLIIAKLKLWAIQDEIRRELPPAIANEIIKPEHTSNTQFYWALAISILCIIYNVLMAIKIYYGYEGG